MYSIVKKKKKKKEGFLIRSLPFRCVVRIKKKKEKGRKTSKSHIR